MLRLISKTRDSRRVQASPGLRRPIAFRPQTRCNPIESSDFRQPDKFTQSILAEQLLQFAKHYVFSLFSAYPARVLALVIPRVNVFTSRYFIADKICVAVITDFFVTDYPAGPRVHVCLYFNHLLL